MYNLSHTRNLITCAVGAPWVRHGMTMISVCVHFENLKAQASRIRVNQYINFIKNDMKENKN